MEYTPSSSMQPPNPNPNPNPNSSMPLHSVAQYTSYPQPQNPNPIDHQHDELQSITPPGVDSYSYTQPANDPSAIMHLQNESLNPPGADPYSYYPDPYAQNFVPQQYSDYAYMPQDVTIPQNGTGQLASSAMWPTQMFQPHAKKNLQRPPKKTKIVQSVYCEVCQLRCDTKDVLSKHKQGKKHKKNLDKLKATLLPPQQPLPVSYTKPDSVPLIGPQENPSNGEPTTGKKSKELGGRATTDAVVHCSVCNVWCNAQDVLDKHNLGKKHLKNMEKLKAPVAPSQPPPPVNLANPNNFPPVGTQENPSQAIVTDMKKSEELGTVATAVEQIMCTVCNIWCNTQDVLNKHNLGKKHQKNMNKSTAAAAAPQENPSATVDERRMCTVCNIWCNTQDVLDRHNLGKKHKKNMDKLTAAALQQLPPPVGLENPDGVSLSGPQENTLMAKEGLGTKRSRKKQAESAEELEVKRRKVLEGGATVDEVRTCTVCNVICNSEKVFRYHVSGAKHIALVKKLGTETALVTAT